MISTYYNKLHIAPNKISKQSKKTCTIKYQTKKLGNLNITMIDIVFQKSQNNEYCPKKDAINKTRCLTGNSAQATAVFKDLLAIHNGCRRFDPEHKIGMQLSVRIPLKDELKSVTDNMVIKTNYIQK